MVVLVTVAMLVSYFGAVLAMYQQIIEIMELEVGQDAVYISAGADHYAADDLEEIDKALEGTRVTLIAPSGEILYDTYGDNIPLENHADRPEIREAFETGEGSDIRYSNSLGTLMFYAARRTDEGNVLRVSKASRSAFWMALRILPVMLAVAAFLFVFEWFLSKWLSRRLVEPINEIDLDDPLKEEIYEELAPLVRRIDHQNQQKDVAETMRKEFSANVSHELKTPLTTISGYAELLKEGLVPQENVRDVASNIYQDVQRMVRLINDIIRLSRLDEGEISESKEEVELLDLTQTVCGLLSKEAENNQVRLTCEGTQAGVPGIRHILEEMIFNIIENAIKYNRPGGYVQVQTGRFPEGTKVIVRDNGIGIPEEEQERIFERFYRIDKSRSKATGGTGLGLSIVKHGALLHDAEVHVESEVGKGTVMEVLFKGEDASSSAASSRTPRRSCRAARGAKHLPNCAAAIRRRL